MNRPEVKRIPHEALPGIRQRFGVLVLVRFEPVARGEAKPGSHIGVLVTFRGGDAKPWPLVEQRHPVSVALR